MRESEIHTTPVWSDLTIAVPLYSRPLELRQLLNSVEEMSILPGELLLCEDNSPDRPLLRAIAAEWVTPLAARGCTVRFIENFENLGYDGNVRSLFDRATRPWVLLLGNDDAMLPDAVRALMRFVASHPGIKMTSRTFIRFKTDINDVQGITRLSQTDRVYTNADTGAGFLLRLCGFVGGLLVDREWAVQLATDRYDGTLYYQMYLAARAFSDNGIGYIAEPLVGSRSGNPPLFGSASKEKASHAPGAYSPRARASMWCGILRIFTDEERRTSLPMVASVRHELSGRQSFHVFELVAVQGRTATLTLVREFSRLGLMRHPLPWGLALIGLIFGRWIRYLFLLVRAVQKRSSARKSRVDERRDSVAVG